MTSLVSHLVSLLTATNLALVWGVWVVGKLIVDPWGDGRRAR